jgi:hypothetical protein
MSRALTSGICDTVGTTGGPSTRTTESLVFALDSADIVANTATACNTSGQGLRRDVAATGAPTAWRDVLRLLYAGMPAGASTDILQRDCNSSARRSLVNNWDDLFEGSCTSCNDSNPDSGVTEPGLSRLQPNFAQQQRCNSNGLAPEPGFEWSDRDSDDRRVLPYSFGSFDDPRCPDHEYLPEG